MSAVPSFCPAARFSGLATLPQLAGVWRAGELPCEAVRTVDTGYPALNAALPGGGWPVGSLTELLQKMPGDGEWGLLAPALALMASADLATTSVKPAPRLPGRAPPAVVLVGAPHAPFGPALAARQLDPSRLLLVQAGLPAAQLWAAEQALRCADVEAVLAWLPRVQMVHLRRLQTAAQEHGKLLFVFRPESAQHEASPAPLRLLLARSQSSGTGRAPALQLHIFKRRGPPLSAPLAICTAPPRLDALLAARRANAQMRRQASAPAWQVFQENLHALDRFAAAG